MRQKSPDFDTIYVPVVMNQKWGTKVQILTQHMSLWSWIKSEAKKSRFWRKLKLSNSTCSKLYFYSKRFRFAPSFNNIVRVVCIRNLFPKFLIDKACTPECLMSRLIRKLSYSDVANNCNVLIWISFSTFIVKLKSHTANYYISLGFFINQKFRT